MDKKKNKEFLFSTINISLILFSFAIILDTRRAKSITPIYLSLSSAFFFSSLFLHPRYPFPRHSSPYHFLLQRIFPSRASVEIQTLRRRSGGGGPRGPGIQRRCCDSCWEARRGVYRREERERVACN